MKEKIIKAMTLATIACWECGDRGYNYSVELSKTTLFMIEVTIFISAILDEKVIYNKGIFINDPNFDAIIEQMVIDIAEKTKELV